MRSIELFAGAGGLALGTALSGFHAVAAVEWDRWACNTLECNRDRGYPLLRDLDIRRGDVRDMDFAGYESSIDLLTGGPPCQPFSIGGKHQAHEDVRDMFSAYARILAQVKPRAFIIENVRGLTRASFTNYLNYIENCMSAPEISRLPSETWEDHSERLTECLTSTAPLGVRYVVEKQLFNSANFGAPQKRDRVFIVGFRTDQDAKWHWPRNTHSQEELIRSQWVTGEYWDRHRVAGRLRPVMPASLRRKVDCLRSVNEHALTAPWQTVRDALIGLPEPLKDGRDHPSIYNHKLQTGARAYAGHTGSPLDLPSKALKAGDHGVPGGENMVVLPDGSVRYFTIREAARLQTFPDGYLFDGAWSEAMRQIGNAVPVVLAQAVASSVAEKLCEAHIRQEVGKQRMQ